VICDCCGVDAEKVVAHRDSDTGEIAYVCVDCVRNIDEVLDEEEP